MEFASFGVAIVGLIIAIVTFAFAKDINKNVRFLVGTAGLLLAAYFGYIGLTSTSKQSTNAQSLIPPTFASTPSPIVQRLITTKVTFAFRAIEPLVINGISYAVPNDSNQRCIANEKTGNSLVRYNISVPKGWFIAWDSYKADWKVGNYQSDGLLGIYGKWEGTVDIEVGEYCAVPVEWANFAINDRRNASPKPTRQSFFIGDVP